MVDRIEAREDREKRKNSEVCRKMEGGRSYG